MHTDFTRYLVVNPIYVTTSAKTLLRQCHAYGPSTVQTVDYCFIIIILIMETDFLIRCQLTMITGANNAKKLMLKIETKTYTVNTAT